MTDYTLIVLATLAIIGFCIVANLQTLSPYWAREYCLESNGTTKLTWSNPQWFACGYEPDRYPFKNYHALGLLPPFTIQSYNEWEAGKK